MSVLAPGGDVQETLEVQGWREHAKRYWPARLRWSAHGSGVWTETVEVVDVSRRYIDAFFVPVDRRSGAPGNATGGGIQKIDLPALIVKSFELPAGTGWAAARERASKMVADESARATKAGRKLDPVPRFKIDSNGRPASVLLNLLPDDGPPPGGWKRLEARIGLMVVLDGVGQLSRARVDELLKAVPDEARPELGYVRHVGGPGSDRIQLVVPLIPR